MDKKEKPVLVVVHPDSACGSLDFNLGAQDRTVGHRLRERLIEELNAWRGDLMVMRGAFTAELSALDYEDLGLALNQALERCRGLDEFMPDGLYGDEWSGDIDDEDWSFVDEAAQVFGRWSRDRPVVLTGIWWNDREDSGCVTAIKSRLEAMGFADIQVSDSAIHEDLERYVVENTETKQRSRYKSGLEP